MWAGWGKYARNQGSIVVSRANLAEVLWKEYAVEAIAMKPEVKKLLWHWLFSVFCGVIVAVEIHIHQYANAAGLAMFLLMNNLKQH